MFFFSGGRDGGDAAQHLPEDGQVEQDEAICWKATLAPDSTASLTNERFLLRLDDSGLDGGGKLRCVRGRECTQDATEWGIGALYWIKLAINTVDSREVPYHYSALHVILIDYVSMHVYFQNTYI